MKALRRLRGWLHAALGQCVHQFNGGAAYEHYLAHWRAHHPEGAPLSADEFHRREQDRRWNGVRRCC